jgi:hypothetical protein
MKKIVRLTENDMTRLVKRIIKETDMDFDMTMDTEEQDGMDVNDVMDFGYDFMSKNAPEGPKNKTQYMEAIEELQKLFGLTIRNLKGNIGM